MNESKTLGTGSGRDGGGAARPARRRRTAALGTPAADALRTLLPVAGLSPHLVHMVRRCRLTL